MIRRFIGACSSQKGQDPHTNTCTFKRKVGKQVACGHNDCVVQTCTALIGQDKHVCMVIREGSYLHFNFDSVRLLGKNIFITPYYELRVKSGVCIYLFCVRARARVCVSACVCVCVCARV